ncbi:hypothetical protein Q428_04330 [Fervidicella metallireducens AeB]|uniref:DUF2225 domain-containing protein n=1 Tax=Fervidicella metallireducens AeB TaxID=1403537 RepID=A0A017RXE6_9CLOT|nr:DUF2225 domain-containing protein [Fervidicella metallireducens]EYE89039.1 hypothetical protein Q428_04330 [Fervidicella metallireducens AeB]
MDNMFSELESMGFKNLNVEIFQKDIEDKDEKKVIEKQKSEEALYDKTFQCPVCGNNFKEKSVKIGKSRLISKDTDLMPIYEGINPMFYDVIICNKCGYSAISKEFDKIKSHQIDSIKLHITTKFKPKTYPDLYDVDIAIERYKLALLNSIIKNGKYSERAYICLKISWLYRLKDDKTNENKFIEQALYGFKEAFERESFPIYGMDSFTLMYLMGELSRRLGNNEEALRWFGKVIISRHVNPKLKELARDQKDLIKTNIS